MHRTLRIAVVLFVASFVTPVAGVAAAQTPTAVVTPAGILDDGQTVTVTGDGWAISTGVNVEECIFRNLGDIPCVSPPVHVVADAHGHISTTYVARRFVQGNDCAVPQTLCFFGVRSDDNTSLFTVTVAFRPNDAGIPDVVLRRRSDGVLLQNDVYTPGPQPYVRHAIAAGGTWTYAVLVQNDGAVADDITVLAFPTAAHNVQYFWGYFDVTAPITGAGLDLGVLAPGESRLLAVRFRADLGTPTGTLFGQELSARAAIAPNLQDDIGLAVTVS